MATCALVEPSIVNTFPAQLGGMRNPHEFVGEIELDDAIKLRGEIDGTEQSLYGEVFNTESVEDGIEVDLNAYALPSNEFYTFTLEEQSTEEEGVDIVLRGRDDRPIEVGTVDEMMVYEPRR